MMTRKQMMKALTLATAVALTLPALVKLAGLLTTLNTLAQ